MDHGDDVDEDDDEYEDKNEARKIGLAVSREKNKIRGQGPNGTGQGRRQKSIGMKGGA